MTSLLTLAAIIGGSVLIVAGCHICVKWYIYWRRNYRGEILTGGPYSRVRHPFYSGFIILAVGVAVTMPAVETLALALISVAGVVFSIPREEGLLLQRFGGEYRDYMQRVLWRRIPGVY
ncbi:MAG: isoprenylcysteine carboxylmethyltransferase family protein [Anaerolineales bacterium]|nr:isoprenylcysteine carboxylmethyltransferase family protein [Anaerolineales bacterium]